MAHFVATRKKLSTVGWARLFLDNVFRLHGLPDEIVSDRDPKFTSSWWTEVCKVMGVKIALSTAFHPQTDGQTERMNMTLEEALRHYTLSSPSSWSQLLS